MCQYTSVPVFKYLDFYSQDIFTPARRLSEVDPGGTSIEYNAVGQKINKYKIDLYGNGHTNLRLPL